MKKGTFIKIKCPRCNNQQVTFGKACTEVKCSNCNNLLTRRKGGKAKIMAKVEAILCH